MSTPSLNPFFAQRSSLEAKIEYIERYLQAPTKPPLKAILTLAGKSILVNVGVDVGSSYDYRYFAISNNLFQECFLPELEFIELTPLVKLLYEDYI